jgi:hypothetical protein
VTGGAIAHYQILDEFGEGGMASSGRGANTCAKTEG